MRRYAALVSALAAGLASASSPNAMVPVVAATAACSKGGPAAPLAALKTAKWAIAEDTVRNATAIALLDCLALPNPVLRDEIGFEALQFWMRSELLAPTTVQSIRTTLLARLSADDPQGFSRPFAALVLAEVARIDRRKPFLTDAQREELVQAAATYLRGVRDYRGFDEKEGWRHGVAHGADLMLQLSLNPALTRVQHEAMLAAIASQVAPASHFYIYGEGSRLMAPVYYLAKRDTLPDAAWDKWFAELADAARLKLPVTQAKLAVHHNLKAFLLALNADGKDSRLQPFVTRSLKALE